MVRSRPPQDSPSARRRIFESTGVCLRLVDQNVLPTPYPTVSIPTQSSTQRNKLSQHKDGLDSGGAPLRRCCGTCVPDGRSVFDHFQKRPRSRALHDKSHTTPLIFGQVAPIFCHAEAGGQRSKHVGPSDTDGSRKLDSWRYNSRGDWLFAQSLFCLESKV